MLRILFILLTLLCCACTEQNVASFELQALFTNGEEGYACYRIPAIVRATDGSIIAFAEGRVQDCGDFGHVDIVYKKSTDAGASWTPLRKLLDHESPQVGNPAPVVLTETGDHQGRIITYYNTGIASEWDTRNGKGLREVWYSYSDDHGTAWSAPVNITTQVHRPNRPDINAEYAYQEDWRSYALTPGHGIQLHHGPHKGRIFIAANHSAGPPEDDFAEYRSHAFYSDNEGSSYTLSDDIDVPSSNEAIAAQLSDGRVMMNIRQQNGEERRRLIALSDDGGASWQDIHFDQDLVDPVCQASLLAYRSSDEGDWLIFSNPESTTDRERMTIKLSQDDGKSWTVKKLIDAGPSAYSDLVQIDDHVGLLYEAGNDGGINFAKMNLQWLVLKE